MMKKKYTNLSFLLLFLFFGNALAFQYPKIPNTLEEMIESSDLIVTGKLGKVISAQKFYGYQKNAESLAKLDKLSSLPLALVAVDYELQIDTIIGGKNNLTMSSEPIKYRIIQSQFVKDRKSIENKKSLFFLIKTPAGNNSYGVKSAIYKLQLNGEKPVSFFSGKENIFVNRVGGKEKLSSDDFLSEVIDLVKLVGK